ncbi:hypothetical protein RB195_020085 [Necator americanus]|uniref:Uncharacterized protein n=1 Tax=Necator americanus TaxID=51031 RepID=A0ABR1CJC6_NECAM
MNLYTPAGGLFETHVTWEDIEEDMQRELDTIASFGPKKIAKNIGDGNGFMSRIILIDPDWQHKDRDLPEKFVVKILTQLTLQQFTENVSKENNIGNNFTSEHMRAAIDYRQKLAHNTEVTVYDHLRNLPEGKVPHPKIYYMRKFSEYNQIKGYIIMDYADNVKTFPIYQNIKPNVIKEILHSKAAFELMSLKFTREEKEMFTENPFTERFAILYTEETIRSTVALFRLFIGDKLTDKADKMEQILSDLVDLPWVDQLADEIVERIRTSDRLYPQRDLLPTARHPP